MSATTYPSTPARPARAILINRTLKAEWTKLRTLPSTWRTAALTLALGVGFGVAFSEVSQWHTMTAQQRQVFGVPVRNVSPAPNERDRAGQTGKSPMTSS